MKSITSVTMLILVASMIFGGTISGVEAQNDPEILLQLANRAQEQIRNQISDNSSDRAKELFQKGLLLRRSKRYHF